MQSLAFLFLLVFLPVVAIAGGDLPEVACRYAMKVADRDGKSFTRAWYFWRTRDRVQTRDEDGDHGEMWERDPQGRIFYRRLFHADRIAVEYMPADLPSQGPGFDWTRLATMLGEDELDRLEIRGTTTIMGRPAEIRSGMIAGQQVELVWLPAERLAARFWKREGMRSVELTLVELSAPSRARAKPVALQEIETYRQIDHADFGDMESDPLVRRLDQHVHKH